MKQSSMINSKFKTRREAEEEERRRHLQHKEDTEARRIAKQVSEAGVFRCTFYGCGKKFENSLERLTHTAQHRRKEDKARAVVKAKMDIRSTLIVNKSGIHIKKFEEKFKDILGEPLPLRLLGYHSVLKMAENMSDVINMIRLYSGAIVLQAVPDKNTREHWNEIQSQKGRIGTMDVSKLGKVEKIRKTPEFLKKTVRDLVADKEGLSFVDFKAFYWMVTGGESLDVDELGYCGMKDLFRNGGMMILRISSGTVAVRCGKSSQPEDVQPYQSPHTRLV